MSDLIASEMQVQVPPDPPALPLTVTHVLEHLFCPRFTYFEYVLGVPERQERRLLVQRGRQAHEERKRINPSYLRKKLGVVKRQFDVPLVSARLGLRGSVDEVLTLNDGSMAPVRLQVRRAQGPGLPESEDPVRPLRPHDPRDLSMPG